MFLIIFSTCTDDGDVRSYIYVAMHIRIELYLYFLSCCEVVLGLASLPYEERLQHLHLHSLNCSCHRQRADLITTYEFLNHKITVDPS